VQQQQQKLKHGPHMMTRQQSRSLQMLMSGLSISECKLRLTALGKS
jgi:hypothetical protein